MGNEKFVRALKAMKPLGLTSNDVSPVLKRLLKVYDNEWPLIEAESYRVLADAVFESREEQFESGEEQVEHKRREGRRRGKRTVEEFDDDYGDTESEYECENESVPPLTRARSALVNKPKNEEIVDVEEGFHGGNGVSIEEEAAEAPSSPPRRSSRHRIGSFASSVSASASASGQRVSSRLQNENEIEGRGKRIACENEIEIEGRGKRITCENEIEGRGKRVACEPPPLVLLPGTSVLKKPKIEVTEDLEKYNYGGCFGTPIVEEIDESSKGFDDCQTSGELKKPEIERDGCTFPFPVMNVVPITAVNACPEPSSHQNENSSDLEELQTDKKGREVQGVSVQFTSSLGAIAEAYMEMDIEEIPSTQFRPGKRETRLTIFNSKDNIQGEAKSSLDHSNDFKGSGHMQSCTEYSICIDGSVHTPARLEYNNTLKGSDLAERSLDHSGGISGSNIPQPSIDMVLKMVEGYTLQSFKILAPDFPVMRLMEKFCQHILNSRNDRVCDEKQTEFVPVAPNLLTSGNETKVRRSPRIKPKTQEPSIPDKTKANAETKDHASSSTMLISLETCQPSVDQSRPVHDLMDISRGEENIQIPITNELTSESYPSAFCYIPKSIVYQNAYINVSLARIGDDDCCSNCSGDCLESPITCACARETGGEYAYTRDGVLKKNFLEEALSIHMKPKPHHYFYCKDCPQERTKNEYKPDSCKGHLIRKFVKECWSKCACSKHCGNRVVQRGIIRKLQVFFTSEGKGWGVRTLEDIPRGAFVCEYVGEILTNMELYNRNNERMRNEKHTYPVLLDADWCSEGVLKDEEALCLDATHYGNVARFINHRCYDANLIEIPVEVESPDRHYYHLAFFTTRKVEAMEELTWDYGIDFDDCDHPIKAFQCHCGSIHCRDAKRLHRRKTLHR